MFLLISPIRTQHNRIFTFFYIVKNNLQFVFNNDCLVYQWELENNILIYYIIFLQPYITTLFGIAKVLSKNVLLNYYIQNSDIINTIYNLLVIYINCFGYNLCSIKFRHLGKNLKKVIFILQFFIINILCDSY